MAHITNKAETLCATPLGPEVGPNLGLSCNQDYHRFHAPVSGKMIKVVNISGYLYTVWFHIQVFFMLNIFFVQLLKVFDLYLWSVIIILLQKAIDRMTS